MFVSAYYFRAHLYTIVPRHVREDMEWMARVGTNAVVVGVLEQDLFAAVENLRVIAKEAKRAGMRVFATPSRWGNLVAGCPKVPSIFCARNFDVHMQDASGNPIIGAFGPLASVHHPATFDFFVSSINQMLEIVPFNGIIWDEPKAFGTRDLSPAARTSLAGKDLNDERTHIDAFCDFFSRVNRAVLAEAPDLRLAMFIYGHLSGYLVERAAAIDGLHDFGCDGRPFAASDGGTDDTDGSPAKKLLCDQGPYFIERARAAGRRPLFLIENHALSSSDIDLMDRRLPEILAMGPEHLLYYYYPRSVAEPDRAMAVIAKYLRS